jgi:hypothetical protein
MTGLSTEVDTRCAFGLKSAIALGFCRIDYLGCLASGLSYPVRAAFIPQLDCDCAIAGGVCAGTSLRSSTVEMRAGTDLWRDAEFLAEWHEHAGNDECRE